MKDILNLIKTSTKKVVSKSQAVTIDEDALHTYCQTLSACDIPHTHLPHAPFELGTLSQSEQISFSLAFNAMSFSYWGDPFWQVTHNDITHTRGSWSLSAALLRSQNEKKNLLNPVIQADITRNELAYALRGNTEIPLLDERLAILNQVGQVICLKYDGEFQNMIKDTNYDAHKLLSRVVFDFPLFDDTAIYDGEKVYFYKRAQALAGSVDAVTSLTGVEGLTGLADYIIPRKLRDAGILKYDAQLAYIVDNGLVIGAGSQLEVEIRAAIVYAMDEMKKDLCVFGIKVSNQQLTDYLWLQGDDEKETPFHKTRTTSY